MFFPNIELRLEVGVNNANEEVNIHIIFSDKTTQEKINDFLSKLKTNITNNGSIVFCNKLSKKGEFEKACVKYDLIKTSLKEVFGNSEEYLIFAAANNQGLRADTKSPRKMNVCDEVDKICDGFFGGNQNISYYLNPDRYEKNDDGTQDIAKKCPVVTGSDAHSFSELTDKLGKEFSKYDSKGKLCDFHEPTWIKSDTAFEGLKQILYEPIDRVKIQELKPEEKNIYELIDSVQFIDNSFSPSKILLNQNLTAIIGGKSTGKSILLRNIAQTIDPKEVVKRLTEVNLPEYTSEVEGFNVVWKDKQANKKNEDTGVSKKIIYIPQSYLNRLVDKKEDKTSIDEIIKDVLEQEEDVKKVFSQLQNNNREIEKNITQSIEDIFYKESDINNLTEKIKKNGDRKGIESEVEKIKKEVSELKKRAGMGEEEIKKYNDLSESIKDLKKLQEKEIQDLDILDNLKSNSDFSKSLLFGSHNLGNESFADFFFKLSDDIRKNLETVVDEVRETIINKWTAKLDEEIHRITKEKNDNQKKLAELLSSYTPLLEKAQKSKSLDEKIKKLEEEEQKLKEIIEQEKNLQSLKDCYKATIKNLAETHSKFFDNFFYAKTKILEQRSITEDQELEFGIEIVFKLKSFKENFIDDICNLKTLGKFEKGLLQEYSRNSNIGFKEDVENIINGILSENLILKNSYSKKEAITRLTKPWFTFDYIIKQNGDEISEMSPGKKSFVLLKLLIELDNSKCPILLDQPEDDLDNRSIYMDLVKFIKIKKKERQIIIATHNPNLVVGADAECVIVANQDGDKSKNKTYLFEYKQGALENTFVDEASKYVLEQRGIQEHVCDILEGGKIAFELRKKKYNI